MNKDNILCIFHKDCLDGMFAAIAFHEAHIYQNKIDQVEFLGVDYKDAIPNNLGEYGVIYMLDFSFEPQHLIAQLKKSKFAGELILIDHHITTIKKWESLGLFTEDDYHNVVPVPYSTKQIDDFRITTYTSTDMSGALLAYMYFTYKEKMGEIAPPYSLFCSEAALHLYQAVDSYDRWTKTIPNTDQIARALMNIAPLDDKNIFPFVLELTSNEWYAGEKLDKLVEIGTILDKQHELLCRKLIERNMRLVAFDGHSVPLINAPKEFASRIGEILSQRDPFAIIYEDQYSHDHGGPIRKFSLRSRVDGETGEPVVNVAEIAKWQGGGGHTTAAGFITGVHAEPFFPELPQ